MAQILGVWLQGFAPPALMLADKLHDGVEVRFFHTKLGKQFNLKQDRHKVSPQSLKHTIVSNIAVRSSLKTGQIKYIMIGSFKFF